MSSLRFVGLDVHADTITVAVAESPGEVRALGKFPNSPESVKSRSERWWTSGDR